MYSMYFYFIEGRVEYLPFKKMNRKTQKGEGGGLVNKSPAGNAWHTEVGSVVLERRSLTPCTFPHVPTAVQMLKFLLSKETGTSGKENYLAQKKWVLLVLVLTGA